MGLFSLFKAPKPKPVVIIRNVLGEEIDRVEGVRDLINADLRGRQWPSVDLSHELLWGANLEGAHLMGARLVHACFYKANLRGVDISYADAWGADFRNADLVGTSLYRSSVKLARFDGALMDERTDIPERNVTGLMRVVS